MIGQVNVFAKNNKENSISHIEIKVMLAFLLTLESLIILWSIHKDVIVTIGIDKFDRQ